MNIKEAKLEISNTLKAYHEKDENGDYVYPLVRQRPILLMGPPGIGKTAIMEQIARENQVGLVSYTITHHTRQSAVGLPRIREKSYEGVTTSVTEYTMSEIIDSVYDCMQRTGNREGILFIDEINCASETLAPTMLQFLQNKTFGSHKVPEGWMIVAAGNPPQYNKSVREFDIVTLDRVRRIDVEVDLAAWLEYAEKNAIHGAILSYLTMKKERFYLIENRAEGKYFVTARGWEDLSQLLKSYERLGLELSEKQMIQFLQKEETAHDFTDYYRLYQKYGQDYAIPQILCGEITEEKLAEKIELAKAGGFEERFIVTELVMSYLQGSFKDWELKEEQLSHLYQQLLRYRKLDGGQTLSEFIEELGRSRQIRMEANLLTNRENSVEKWCIRKLQNYALTVKEKHIPDDKEAVLSMVRSLFDVDKQERSGRISSQKQILERAFDFLIKCYGDGQEITLFVTRLAVCDAVMHFISEHGSDSFFQYSGKLIYKTKELELRKACMEEIENVDQ